MTYSKSGLRILTLLIAMFCAAGFVRAEDIDLFIGANSDADSSGLPNVIFVLDNTSNWARQSQGWLGGKTQGQSEVDAIKQVMADVLAKIEADSVSGLNVGLMEFTTGGNANQDGGFVRFDLQPLTATSKAALDVELDEIWNNINDPDEKRNSGSPYGNLMYDVYNYLAGNAQSFSGAGTVASKADPAGYSSQYGVFESPLAGGALCAKTYLIFIGNPAQSGPSADSTDNSAALKALYEEADVSAPDGLANSSSPAPIPIPEFTVTTKTEPAIDLGYSKSCHAYEKNKDEVNAAGLLACNTAESGAGGLCEGKTSCACDNTQRDATGCANKTSKFKVLEGGQTSTVVTAVPGAYDTSAGRPWNMDDWSKFLFNYGVPVTQTNAQGESFVERASVITFAIDVFNKQQSEDHTGLMLSASKGVGGGEYYAAKNEEAIVDAITAALSSIISESSVFAAATLPLSSADGTQSENQVYYGMFRPDQQARPRWYGNMKRYQFAIYDGQPALADADFKPASDSLSGFVAECARSFWSTDSSDYWDGLGIVPAPLSKCLDSITSPWSDAPDGPFVEKGAAGQVSRNGSPSSRSILSMSSLAAVTSTDVAVLDYLKGSEVGADGELKNADDDGRPSLHGDVVHSRPLAISYGKTKDTYIFYGSNDGLYRAIKASTGGEEWALIAPEHYSKIERLYENSPKIDFPGQIVPDGEVAREAKTYFVDGSTGQHIEYDDDRTVTKAWIYPTMRRGGRMVYALDVTDPAAPKAMWSVGCGESTCTSGFDSIGQTWSTPISAMIEGYSAGPVLMFGGGYDSCLDKDQKAYPCNTSATGSAVYMVDAEDGTFLKKFDTDGPVVSDVVPVDINNDGKVDFAYAASAKGTVYRINFAELDVNGGVSALSDSDDWIGTPVAATNDSSRRFLNTPAVLAIKDRVFVTLGSGNRERPLESNYPYTEEVEDRFYAFVDFPAANSDSVDLDDTDDMLDVTNLRAPGTGVSCDAKGARGWFLGMTGRGEQVVNPSIIAGGNVLFNSYRPGGETQAGSCRALGLGTAYKINLLSPACNVESRVISSDGMPIAPTIATIVAPICTSEGVCSGEKQVTVCVGCKEPTAPTEVIPTPPSVRKRTYWGGDVDR